MVTRRAFLSASAAILVVGVRLVESAPNDPPQPLPSPFDAWIHVDESGLVTILVPKAEMGQGVRTSLAMIVADELEVEWTAVRVEQAPTNLALYDHGTYGSSSLRTSYLPFRRSAAAAREMLRSAAARRWNVPLSTVRASRGSIEEAGSGRRIAYSELVAAAAQLPIPDPVAVPLKAEADFAVVGKDQLTIDVAAKVTGRATYGIDVRRPGMLQAVVARCPTFGGALVRFDDRKARLVPGVRFVVPLPASGPPAFTVGGVGVIADTTWAAIRGRAALEAEWEHGPLAGENDGTLSAHFREALAGPGLVLRDEGDAASALRRAARTVEASYELPFQAHATMEPMNCTVAIHPAHAEAWVPCQDPETPRKEIARVAGLGVENVTIHTTLMGCGFGRRDHSDFAVEAAQLSKAAGVPVQVVWTREDDIQHDFYRPAALHVLAASLDSTGQPTAWHDRMSSVSITRFWSSDKATHPEESEIGGAVDMPYTIPSLRVEYAAARSPIPVTWWRSVAHSMNVFAVESFVDEMAHAASTDPVAFRLRLLREGPTLRENGEGAHEVIDRGRLARVLELAALRAGWGSPRRRGHGQGVALLVRHGTYAAQVVDVDASSGRLRVERVVCAIDCGRVVHPSGARAQVEGGVAYGMTAALKGSITIQEGRCLQANFHDYPILRIDEMPLIEAHFVPSTDPPSGLGEPAVAAVAPAIANALFAATGRRARRLPIGSDVSA